MAEIIYYTKTGCATAKKQVDLLRQSGHIVEVRDLLTHNWSAAELLSYFGNLPVADWFNEKSPRVKDGEIKPTDYTAEEGLHLMLADHLLIRRPLMESGGERRCGFDMTAIREWIGIDESLYQNSDENNFTVCSQTLSRQTCP